MLRVQLSVLGSRFTELSGYICWENTEIPKNLRLELLKAFMYYFNCIARQEGRFCKNPGLHSVTFLFTSNANVFKILTFQRTCRVNVGIWCKLWGVQSCNWMLLLLGTVQFRTVVLCYVMYDWLTQRKALSSISSEQGRSSKVHTGDQATCWEMIKHIHKHTSRHKHTCIYIHKGASRYSEHTDVGHWGEFHRTNIFSATSEFIKSFKLN